MSTEIVPRVYQKQAIEAALAGLTGRSRRALVVLATGLGKTLTGAFIAKKFKARKILFLVHSNFILKHAVDEFALIFDPEKTKMVVYNGLSKEGASEADIVFATWQTMGRNLKEWRRNHFDLIVVDEAHHTEAKTYKPTLKHFNAAKLGMTATPNRDDELDIRPIFGEEVVDISLEEGIAKGWLPKIEYHVMTDESLDDDALQQIVGDIRRGKKRFSMAEVNKRIFIKQRDEEIANIINGYKEKAVVFCVSISHAERMRTALEKAATFHSKKGNDQKDTQDKNQAVLETLEEGSIRRVCAVNAFNEGVNVPSVGLVAFCRVTQVETVFRQQLGRGLRPGKDKLIVLDFVGNLERIRLILEMVEKIKGFGPPRGKRERGPNQRFDVSGAGFEFTFSDKIVDLVEILKNVERGFYPTWEEAAEAVRRLGIGKHREYFKRYKEDPRLHAAPDVFYRDVWREKGKWHGFFGGKKKEYYLTWQEASLAVIKLGIDEHQDYTQRYQEDPSLPSNPHTFYSDFPGYPTFFGREKKKNFYPTWQEAAEAARKIGIKNSIEYMNGMYKKDKKLPSNPHNHYPDFPGWPVFFGGVKKRIYPTWQKASVAAKRLKITSRIDYINNKRYKEDPSLPSNPHTFYSDFPGYPIFLGMK